MPDRPIRLVPTLRWVCQDDALTLLRDTKAVRVKGDRETLTLIASALERGTTRDELTLHAPADVIDAFLARLDAENWLSSELSTPEAPGMPWERQLGYLTLFGTEAGRMQERLRAARVGILGVGGIGGLVAQHLVGAGAGALWLIDDDVVATHNLNRQYLFSRKDLGRPKVEAAVDALTAQSEHTGYHPIRLAVRSAEDLSVLPDDLDLLVCAADVPTDIALICWRWAGPAGVALVSGAVGLGSGYWGPLVVPGRGGCLDCFDHAKRARMSPLEHELRRALTDPTPYSFGPSNSVIAAMLAHDVCQYLASGDCASLNRRAILRFGEGLSFFDPSPESRCPAHEND
ncbi:ThiF family adenylyltransferase [Allokutzneria albata]|uniref:ThiF family protein n=1 Tax=Allokutzneria albata TaxID=211114 RepID=A0A1G9TZC5_ALLAB|nr:ThiF family adenylyltransferase [Allokutzneria albata]SDM53140.1 ThiF family protein [Allokutzneria albata]